MDGQLVHTGCRQKNCLRNLARQICVSLRAVQQVPQGVGFAARGLHWRRPPADRSSAPAPQYTHEATLEALAAEIARLGRFVRLWSAIIQLLQVRVANTVVAAANDELFVPAGSMNCWACSKSSPPTATRVPCTKSRRNRSK